MSEAVRFGFLSTAKISDLLLAGAEPSDRVDVVAVASRDERRAEAYARARGIERAHGSYDALLDDPEVEAVYVSLPNSLHVEWSVRALEAGKHVLCEKPLSRRSADVEHAFDVADRTGRILMEAFMYRHNPQTAHVEELVRRAAVGRLRFVRATFTYPHTDLENIRHDPGLDGGGLMDLGCYGVHASRMLAGEPEEVFGEQVVSRSGVDEVFAGTMRFADDVLAHVDCALVAPTSYRLEAVGEKGSLSVADPWHCRKPGIELRTEAGTETISLDPVDSYRLQLENMSAAVRGEGEPRLGRADALGQARTIEALYRSADEGRPVSIHSAGFEAER